MLGSADIAYRSFTVLYKICKYLGYSVLLLSLLLLLLLLLLFKAYKPGRRLLIFTRK